MSSTYVQTTLDYLNALKQFSGFEVDYIHVTHQAVMGVDFDSYDIVFHNYCARLCYDDYVSSSYKGSLRKFSGVKVLAVQDEYDRTDTLKAAIKDLGFDIVLTCVPQDSLEYVYPRSEFPDVEFITVFTGYVPDDFAEGAPPPKRLADRPIFIGYRGRDIGGRYGRLGFDKFEIGRRMKELCDARGIATNIAMDEASRIYGRAWLEFVGDCRAMLGAESGSNVFDFDGSIEASFKEMTAANGGAAPSYAEFLPIVALRDSEIEMGQISPRIFECAMAWTPMVLFRGRYSNALQPDEHYIALEKDFSNLDEVLARLADLPALEAMTQRAFDHLVGSGQFTYRAFYRRVSAAIELKLAKLSRVRSELKGATAQALWSADLPDRLLELPTPWPCGPESFKMRQEIAEAALYRREFDRLIGEFARLRSAFVPEIDRIRLSYQRTLSLFGQSAPEMLMPPAAAASDNSFTGLLAAYDDEIGTASIQRISARENFSAALSRNMEQDSSQMLRHMLAIERDGYFNLIEWIRRLNESYQAERVELDRQYQERMRWLVARVLPQLPLKQQLKVRYILSKMRLRRLSSVALRGLAHSALARRIVAVPALGALTRRVATRMKLTGLT